MCEERASATPQSEEITVCWETEHRQPWDTGYAGELLDIYSARYPAARKITLCVNGEHLAGRIRHG